MDQLKAMIAQANADFRARNSRLPIISEDRQIEIALELDEAR